MEEKNPEHVSERFARLLDLYRRPDGSEWGGKDLERATGGAVKRAYASLLKRGHIEHPGMDKLAAIASAMGFPPGLWFGDEEGFADEALLAALKDPTTGAIVREAAKLRGRDRELLLAAARGIASSAAPDPDAPDPDAPDPGGGAPAR